MEKIREALFNRKVPSNSQEDESEKCCGKCMFVRIAQDMGLKCMRHKIRTDYICRCGDWRGKESA